MIKITNEKLMIALAIVVIAVIFNQQILEAWGMVTEHFRQGRRFFWGYNPTSRNSSYDIRSDKDVRTEYKPKEAGAFYESGLYPNFQ